MKAVLRNVAVVSAIFIVTFSIMLVTNYFQVRGVTPLQTEVVETLKEINDRNVNNPVLQEQIRQLDLLARKAYFVRMDHLLTGVYILLGMLTVFIVCTRLYFARDKDIPGKEIDPIDEWAIKTQARKYVVWIASGIAATALVFVVLSSPYLKPFQQAGEADPSGEVAGLQGGENVLPESGTAGGDAQALGIEAGIAEATPGAADVSGAADASGASGEVGTSGVADASGAAGTSGVADASGVADGTSGSAGASGVADGASGSADASGVADASGAIGTSGAADATGSSGEVGTSGVADASGAIGTAGASGAAAATSQDAVSKVTHNAFRGNNSNGISSARGLPVKWNLSNGTNIAWKQAIPRKGYNSPVINGNKVFFSGADDQARELFCYDLTTGEKLWSLAATRISGSPSQMPQTTEDTGLAASSVATNGRQVCAIFATGDIICADVNGKQLWGKNLGVPDNHYGYASSLLIFGNVVIIQYDNRNAPKVLALDLATGAERWSKSRTEKVTWSSPIIANVDNTSQLVLMGNPAITAYNPNNGEQLWRVECLSGEVGSSACSSNGVVFGASEYAKLIAINGADGSVLWESTDFLPEVASPVATSDHLYLATSYGVVAAYDARTGELRKEHELNTEFYSSPIIAEGRIYLFSNDGTMHIFSANNDFNLLDSFETGERTLATPAFTDGKIVVRTEKSLYCVRNN
ncbi:MAG: PQQ-binding-like beta-propeller repeat protein [Tannerella sp.]|jgi:outer membrane protein assembly factor BamB|nr:PQQ-binding-like beta-propeller repeat protein [Tannerella sp.]